jgi:hypothetical protein
VIRLYAGFAVTILTIVYIHNPCLGAPVLLTGLGAMVSGVHRITRTWA